MAEENIIPINIEEQMRTAYIDYSMSVIVSRALPDVRDGLKPVHRRVLYGMYELGVTSSRPYKKSARIVGEVLGKYHPHGDTSVYDTMVRMAQPWSLRYPMVDGQGNFGSIDGDNPAAMRYTEARLRKIAEEMVADIDKETVDHELNFDDTIWEPVVLPARIPNLLVNGAAGIAVGMATNMPPHALTETVDATIAYIDDKAISIQGLMEHIKAPDFPTGGIINGREGVEQAYRTGKGRVILRGKARFEEERGKESIIVEEIPYMVNKAELIRKTAEMVNEKKLEGISDIRDESDKQGLRIVYELKRDAIPDVVLNKLYKYTQLQTSFGVNNIALVNGKPELLDLKGLIHQFVEHRHDVVVRRTQYELRKADERAHVLEGLLIAIDNLDEVIELIRGSRTPDEAKNSLMEKFELSEVQAKAILDMRLQKLTGLEREKVKEEHEELRKWIDYYKQVLDNEDMRMDIIKDELKEIKEQYGDERRTEIMESEEDMRTEDMIPDEQVVVTISHLGYIKRTKLDEYRVQGRGGVGSKGSTTRDSDFLEHLFVATNHNYLLIFTEKGKCYWMRVFEIPEGSKASKGRAIQNLINIDQEDTIKTYINVQDLKDETHINNHYIMMCTKKGVVKKTFLEAYSRPRQTGINAVSIREGDELLEAKLTDGNSEVILGASSGKAIRFGEQHVRAMGRNAAGVRGIGLSNKEDEVVGMECIPKDELDTTILVVSEKGYGKRSPLAEYRQTNRGGKGVKTMNLTKKTGSLVSINAVNDDDEIMVINRSGITIRTAVGELRIMGRATQGVRLINLRKDDRIASVAKIDLENGEREPEKDESSEEEGGEEAS
ncbi:MAG: DNA gyrase subunit A [Flavobacteriales bacterium]